MAVREKNLSFLILILWNLYSAVTFIECRVSSSYFFLFFGLPPIFSFFFSWNSKFFLFFRILLGTQKHFEVFEMKLPIKLINSTKNWNFMSKDQFEAFLSDFFVSNEIWNLVIVVGWVVLGNIGGNTCFCLHGNALWMYAMCLLNIKVLGYGTELLLGVLRG